MIGEVVCLFVLHCQASVLQVNEVVSKEGMQGSCFPVVYAAKICGQWEVPWLPWAAFTFGRSLEC